MDFPDKTSDRVRKLVASIVAEANRVERDLAAPLRGKMSPATLYKVLGGSKPLTPDQVNHLVTAAAIIANVPAEKLFKVLHRPLDRAFLADAEPTIAQLKTAGGNEHERLMRIVKTAESSYLRKWIFSKNIPPPFVEADAAAIAIKNIAGANATDARKAAGKLRDSIEDLRESFMLNPPAPRQRIIVVTLLSALLALVEKSGPWRGCREEHVAASLLSLLHDAVIARDVTFAFLNDLANPAVRDWARQFELFESIWLYDSRLLIKRRQGTLACRLFESSDGAEARDVIREHQLALQSGTALACHRLDQASIARFLKEFMKAAGYESGDPPTN